MVTLPSDAYVDTRNGGYYVVGTRVSIESVATASQCGVNIDEIVADFPALKSRANLEGAIEFIKAHPEAICLYLAEGCRAWEEARKLNPAETVERARAYRAARGF